MLRNGLELERPSCQARGREWLADEGVLAPTWFQEGPEIPIQHGQEGSG